MALARLEIEIDDYADLKITYEDRRGERHVYEGTDAWRSYYHITGQSWELHGTLDEVRDRYLSQLLMRGWDTKEIAERMGVASRTVRAWLSGERSQVRLHPKAQEAYENKGLRSSNDAAEAA